MGSVRVPEDLLNMYIHLSKYGRRYRAAVSFVCEEGHALLDAERFQDRFRNSEGETIEWRSQDYSIVSLVLGIQTPSHRRSDLTENLRRDMFRASLECSDDIVRP